MSAHTLFIFVLNYSITINQPTDNAFLCVLIEQGSTTSISMAGLDEYRGSKKWEGLIPSETEPRVWDEGFRSFLIKYVHTADRVQPLTVNFVPGTWTTAKRAARRRTRDRSKYHNVHAACKDYTVALREND